MPERFPPAGSGDGAVDAEDGRRGHRCARTHGGGRAIPRDALDALRAWLSGGEPPPIGPREGRAHQRLLHEFVREHLADGRALRAFDAWATGAGEE